jgi:histone acetyltransferase (RNA polymerase elongator complex component)
VIGYGIAHVSYSRLKLDQKLAWQHRQIAHELVARAERFART